MNIRRLAHINYKVLPYICKVVTGLPELKVDQERHMQWMCTREEHQEPISEKGQQGRRSPRTHVCGPMPSSSINGKFKEFKALIENLSERNIKILMSDNGGEYT